MPRTLFLSSWNIVGIHQYLETWVFTVPPQPTEFALTRVILAGRYSDWRALKSKGEIIAGRVGKRKAKQNVPHWEGA